MKNEDVDGDDSTNTISEDAVLPWVNTTTRQMVTCYAETLKYDPVDDNQFHSKRRKRSNSPKQSPRRKSLVFNETVKVIAIPMRNEYSNQVRSKLWSNPLELQQNAARNAIEFASEGWNWRTVVEDELMYVCGVTGALIHPCHYNPNFHAGNPSTSLQEE